MMRWRLALGGMFLFVFAVVCLSGPGQIDVIDGRVRYEAARGFVDHGDVDIQDPSIQFTVLTGRGGRRYSQYRFPQSAAGVAAIVAADATGPTHEARREFFFSLTGAVAAAALGVTYAVLFRRLGLAPRASLLWGLGGVFCTPSWYYATSTFDDILGSAAVVLALALALTGAQGSRRLARAAACGLALGLAFNCKQPLGVFVLPALAAFHDPNESRSSRSKQFALITGLLAVGVAVQMGYEWYKFPNGTSAAHAARTPYTVPTWSRDPLLALAVLLVSPAAGVFFYNPPLALCLSGLRIWYRTRRGFCLALGAAVIGFVLFICSLSYFKGDPAWGPRYLTPDFAVLWILAPWGFHQFRRRRLVIGLLAAGLLVQVGALAVDPYRIYLKNGLLMPFYVTSPELYFHPALSHLLNRPLEIAEILSPHDRSSIYFSPPDRPGFYSVVFLDSLGRLFSRDTDAAVLDSLRPWWASLRAFDAGKRPVDVSKTVGLFLSLALTGATLMAVSSRPSRRSCSINLIAAGACAVRQHVESTQQGSEVNR